MHIQLTRADGASPIDLQSFNGPAASLGNYSYLSDSVNGDPAGLKKSTVYNVWIDMAVGPVIVNTNSTPPQTNQTVYSVYIATNGAPSRAELFTNFTSDADYINFDPTAGIPGTNYDRIFITHDGTYFGTNNVLLDDFYISTNGFNSTVPVAASTFNPSSPITIALLGGGTNLLYTPGSPPSVTLTWKDTGCGPYTVLRKLSLTDPGWTTVQSAIANSGGPTTSYTDLSLTAADTNAFYRITSP
jgi:hypothetical protein